MNSKSEEEKEKNDINEKSEEEGDKIKEKSEEEGDEIKEKSEEEGDEIKEKSECEKKVKTWDKKRRRENRSRNLEKKMLKKCWNNKDGLIKWHDHLEKDKRKQKEKRKRKKKKVR